MDCCLLVFSCLFLDSYYLYCFGEAFFLSFYYIFIVVLLALLELPYCWLYYLFTRTSGLPGYPGWFLVFVVHIYTSLGSGS